MFWGVVDLDLGRDPPGLIGRKRFVERGQRVRVQVVHHQSDCRRAWVVNINQILDLYRPIDPRSSRRHLGGAPVAKRLGEHEHIRRSSSFVLVVQTTRLSRTGRNRGACLTDQLFTRLVHADHRPLWIVRLLIEFQHIFHRCNELSALFWWNAPVLFGVRLQLVFFSV